MLSMSSLTPHTAMVSVLDFSPEDAAVLEQAVTAVIADMVRQIGISRREMRMEPSGRPRSGFLKCFAAIASVFTTWPATW
ncbi:hypothetical protein GCM10027203_67860 [Nonomuraea fastidiosa]